MPTLPFVLDGISKVAARGLRFTSDYTTGLAKRNDEPPQFPEMPKWGVVVVTVTALLFVFLLVSIQYTIGDVISTLAMIETPATAVTFVEADEPDNTLDKEQKEGLLESAPVITTVPVKPITSKIRTTLKHLTAQAGRTSRWRGIVPAIVYTFLVGITTNLFDAVVPQGIPIRMSLIQTLAALPLARVHMVWTHAMISMPSNKKWYQRLAPLSAYKQLWFPTIAANMAAVYAIYAVSAFGALISGITLSPTVTKLQHGETVTGSEMAGSAATVVGVIAFAIFCGLFIVLPAHVTLVRIEASMLPEEHDTIVPFDRTFGGKVTPKVLGGTGAIGFVDAWKTFNWEARRRLIKLYVKSAMIQVFTIFSAFHILAFETMAIMGNDIKHYVCKLKMYEKEHSQ